MANIAWRRCFKTAGATLKCAQLPVKTGIAHGRDKAENMTAMSEVMVKRFLSAALVDKTPQLLRREKGNGAIDANRQERACIF
jgi:hypothetical protein